MEETVVSENEENHRKITRRDFLKYTAGVAAAAGATSLLGNIPSFQPQVKSPAPIPLATAAANIEEVTIAQLQAMMAAGTLTSVSLVNMYIARITTLDQSGPTLNSIIQVNPDARKIAQQLDAERTAGHIR